MSPWKTPWHEYQAWLKKQPQNELHTCDLCGGSGEREIECIECGSMYSVECDGCDGNGVTTKCQVTFEEWIKMQNRDTDRLLEWVNGEPRKPSPYKKITFFGEEV